MFYNDLSYLTHQKISVLVVCVNSVLFSQAETAEWNIQKEYNVLKNVEVTSFSDY